MGHTPGPWVNSSGYITATDGSEITDVAWSGSDPEGKANARLIAAAPELLAACKKLIAFEEALSCIEGFCYAWEEACEAIAKAEGKSDETPPD